MNPFRLATILHLDPDAGEAPVEGSAEARRYLDHWLRQLGHFDPLVAAEYLEAPNLLGTLLHTTASFDALRKRVREDELLHHWGLCRLLLAEGERAVETSAVLAWHLVQLAVEIAERLDPEMYHSAWVADLEARACCSLSESCRRLGRDAEARSALSRAQRRASQGTRDPDLHERISRLSRHLLANVEESPKIAPPTATDDASSQSAA